MLELSPFFIFKKLNVVKKIKYWIKKQFDSTLGLGGWISSNVLLRTSGNYYRSFAYSCINARAENVTKASIYLFDGKKEITEEHQFLEIINGYNSYRQSFKDLIYLLSVNLDLYGVGYFFIGRNLFGIPIELISIPSTQMRYNINNTGDKIEYFEENRAGRSYRYSPEDIIFFRLPSPDNMFGGKATASACRHTLNIDEYQLMYQDKFYQNDAKLSGIIESQNELDDEQYKRLKDQFDTQYSGAINSGKTLILEGGMNYKVAQANPRQLDYVESRKNTRDEILSIFRVPKTILGITDDVNRANAEAGMHSFLENTIIPFSNHIYPKINIFVKENFGKNYSIKYDFSLAEDPNVQIARDKMLIETGTVTRNEIREQYGYEPRKESFADKLILPSNYIN